MKNTEKPPPETYLNLNASVRLNGEAIDYYPLLYRQTINDRLWQKDKEKKDQLSLLKRLKVQVVSDMDWCRDLWNQFSPHKSLFDTWDFRYAFWIGYPNDPYFLTLFIDESPVAVLPLWYEKSKNKYFWFGSWWQEDNSFFVKDDFFTPLLIALAPKPLHLNAVNSHGKRQLNGSGNFVDDDPKYVLDLDRFSNSDEYLLTLKKKKRYNIRRDKKIIEAGNPRIIINRFSDYNRMISLTKQRFTTKGEDCDFDDPARIEQFRQIIKLGRRNKQYQIRMLTVIIKNKIAAVDLIAIYNNIYYTLKCSSDVKNNPGIGNYMNLVEIDDAISLGVDRIDFLEENYGWKDKWFKSIPLYKLEK